MALSFKDLDRTQAAGVLARMALAVASDGENPASNPILVDEPHFRDEIAAEASRELGKAEPKDAFADWLELKAEEIAEPVDEAAAVARLSESGALPSDVYEIVYNIDRQFLEVVDDRHLVPATVKEPDYLQNFGGEQFEGSPRLLSLFGKWFSRDDKENRFLLLAIGIRQGLRLIVEQVYRLYPSDLHFGPVIDRLSDLARRFAEKYGVTFRYRDFQGKFLYALQVPDANNVKFDIVKPTKKARRSTISFMWMTSTGSKGDRWPDGFQEISFAMCIDLLEYAKDRTRHIQREAKREIRLEGRSA